MKRKIQEFTKLQPDVAMLATAMNPMSNQMGQEYGAHCARLTGVSLKECPPCHYFPVFQADVFLPPKQPQGADRPLKLIF